MRITKAQIGNLWRNDWFKVALLVVISTLIRFYKLSKEILWMDEIYCTDLIFSNETLGLMIDKIHAYGHPPLYYTLCPLWGKIFGIQQNTLILLSIITGVISIVLMYFIVKKLFGTKNLAFASSLLASFSLFHFHYSREVTDYSLFTMMAFLSILSFLILLESKPQHKLRNSLFYLVTTGYLFLSHNYGFLIVLVQNLAFFIFWKRHKGLIKTWIILQIIMLLIISPQVIRSYENAEFYSDLRGEELLDISSSRNYYIQNIEDQSKRVFRYNAWDLGKAADYYFAPKESLTSVISIISHILILLFILTGILLSIFKIRLKQIKKEKGFVTINKENLFGMVLLLLLFFAPLMLTSIFPVVFRVKGFVYTILVFNTLITLGIWTLFKNKALRAVLVFCFVFLGALTISHSLETNTFFDTTIEGWRGASEFLKQPGNRDRVIITNADDAIPFLYEYDFALVDEAAAFHLTSIGGKRMVKITPFFKDNVTQQGYIKAEYEDMLGTSHIEILDKFWLVSSDFQNPIYSRDFFKRVEESFINLSHRYYGTVQVVKYDKK